MTNSRPSSTCRRARLGSIRDSGARPLGHGAVIIEHETGPELVLLVTHIANAMDPVVTLATAVGMVVGMGRWVRDMLEAARRKPLPYPAFRDAQCVRFERRRIRPDGTVDVAVISTTTLDEPFDVDAISARLSGVFGAG